MLRTYSISIFILLIGTGLFGNTTYAQLTNPGVNAPRIDLSIKYPKPGEELTAEIKNYRPDNNTHDLRWYINGNSEAAYNNQREITINAPALGKQITIETKRNGEIVATKSIKPVYVDIITEPDTYVPARFPGRPAPTPNSFVTFTAIVEEGESLPASSYQYEWKKNGNSAKGEYVTGSQITIPIENRKNHTISVTVSHPDRGIIGQEFIQIPVLKPFVNLYEIHALYGRLHKSLENNKQMNTNQLQLLAIPYYYNNEILRNNPEISWSINNNEVQRGGSRISLERIRERGSSLIEFTIKGQEVMDQRVRKTLNLLY